MSHLLILWGSLYAAQPQMRELLDRPKEWKLLVLGRSVFTQSAETRIRRPATPQLIFLGGTKPTLQHITSTAQMKAMRSGVTTTDNAATARHNDTRMRPPRVTMTQQRNVATTMTQQRDDATTQRHYEDVTTAVIMIAATRQPRRGVEAGRDHGRGWDCSGGGYATGFPILFYARRRATR
ncbi:hypothetical protein EDB85DRAFT_1892904 [Lactarius pseudohatsudake]|nr:hypothetical protein EDB85DRAFT_1892904 [Lactarius pseudohatsudake]